MNRISWILLSLATVTFASDLQAQFFTVRNDPRYRRGRVFFYGVPGFYANDFASFDTTEPVGFLPGRNTVSSSVVSRSFTQVNSGSNSWMVFPNSINTVSLNRAVPNVTRVRFIVSSENSGAENTNSTNRSTVSATGSGNDGVLVGPKEPGGKKTDEKPGDQKKDESNDSKPLNAINTSLLEMKATLAKTNSELEDIDMLSTVVTISTLKQLNASSQKLSKAIVRLNALEAELIKISDVDEKKEKSNLIERFKAAIDALKKAIGEAKVSAM